MIKYLNHLLGVQTALSSESFIERNGKERRRERKKVRVDNCRMPLISQFAVYPVYHIHSEHKTVYASLFAHILNLFKHDVTNISNLIVD